MGYRKRTNAKTDEIIEVNEEIVPQEVPQEEGKIEPDISPRKSGSPEGLTPNNAETEAARRKQEIADKRRASLALARSKIVPKSALKKQAAEVIKSKDELLRNKQEETDAMRLKYERDRVKQLEDSLMTLQKLVAERPTPVAEVKPEPVAPVVEAKPKYKRPSRSKEAIAALALREEPTKQPQQIIPKKSVEPRMVAAAPPSNETLIDKSYGEQLQERLRSQAINKIMMETFGGF